MHLQLCSKKSNSEKENDTVTVGEGQSQHTCERAPAARSTAAPLQIVEV